MSDTPREASIRASAELYAAELRKNRLAIPQVSEVKEIPFSTLSRATYALQKIKKMSAAITSEYRCNPDLYEPSNLKSINDVARIGLGGPVSGGFDEIAYTKVYRQCPYPGGRPVDEDSMITALELLSGDFSHNNVAEAKKCLQEALKTITYNKTSRADLF